MPWWAWLLLAWFLFSIPLGFFCGWWLKEGRNRWL
jgi:hypothetical protein